MDVIRKVFFIDQEGKEICDPEIDMHELLAENIISKDPNLLEDFSKTNLTSKSLFLVIKEGYLQAIDSNRYKEVAYWGPKLSEKQKMCLASYYDDGYDLINFKEEYASLNKEELNQNIADTIQEVK